MRDIVKHAVELIYDNDCPNIEAARVQLRKAFEEAGREAKWQEWDRAQEDAPDYVRQYGSPTVLINGKDVSGEGSAADSSCCRVYRNANGHFQGVPSIDAIRDALVNSF